MGYDLRVRRTYNSRSTSVGIFGKHWCSELETRLFIDPADGVVHVQCGAGLATPFYARGRDADSVIKAVGAASSSRSDLSSRRATLLRNPLIRAKTLSGATPPQLPVGRQYFLRGRGPEIIEVTGDGFRYSQEDGSLSEFDKEGKLVELLDRSGNYLKIEYNDNDKMDKVLRDDGRYLAMSYNKSGLVEEVADGESKVRYNYDDRNNLNEVVAQSGHISYKYDLHDQIASVHDGGREWKLKTDVDGKTKQIVKDDGCSIVFSYPKAASDDYSIKVEGTKCKQDVSHSYHLIYDTIDQGTQRILKRSEDIAGTVKTVVEYHPIFQKPVKVEDANGVVTYSYDAVGLLSQIRGPGERYQVMEYDSGCRKPSKVNTDGGDRLFEYDPKLCNLISAQDSNGQIVHIHYDGKGRISILEGDKNVYISYENVFGKPSDVAVADTGEIHVSYKPDGEIAAVTSSSGPTVAASVAGQFNQLLDLVSSIELDGDATRSSVLGKNCSCSPDLDLFDNLAW